MKPDIGTYFELANGVIAHNEPSFSYLNFTGADIEDWRTQVRGKVFELLAFNPPAHSFHATIDGAHEEEGVVTEAISYDLPYGPRVEGFFLYPSGHREELPAVVALHDHGGFKYLGKEKIVATPDEPEILKEFKVEYYGGRSWATELARRGFAVLVIDLFLWGSRKVAVDSLSDIFADRFKELEPGSRPYIEAYNTFAAEQGIP